MRELEQQCVEVLLCIQVFNGWVVLSVFRNMHNNGTRVRVDTMASAWPQTPN